MREPTTVAEVLREEFMVPLGLTVQDVSEKTHLPVSILQGILLNKIRISESIAKSLSSGLGVSKGFWLNLQQNMDAFAESIRKGLEDSKKGRTYSMEEVNEKTSFIQNFGRKAFLHLEDHFYKASEALEASTKKRTLHLQGVDLQINHHNALQYIQKGIKKASKEGVRGLLFKIQGSLNKGVLKSVLIKSGYEQVTVGEEGGILRIYLEW